MCAIAVGIAGGVGYTLEHFRTGIAAGVAAGVFVQTLVALLRRIRCIHCDASLCGKWMGDMTFNPKECPQCKEPIEGYAW